MKAFRKATELDPTDAGSWLLLGYSLLIQGKREESTDAFHKATEDDGTDTMAWTGIGMASGIFDQAKEKLRKEGKPSLFDKETRDLFLQKKPKRRFRDYFRGKKKSKKH